MPAAMDEVRLENRDGAQLEQFVERLAQRQPLAGRERDPRATRELGHRPRLLGRAGLLEEPRPVGLEHAEVLGRHLRRAAPVEIDHQLDLVTDRIADGRHRGVGVTEDGAPVERRRARDHHLELDRVKPGLHRLERLIAGFAGLERVVDGLHLAAAEVVVEPDLVADVATQQLPHRHPERFAEDVPARLLDPGDRRSFDHPGAEEVLAHHHLEQMLDPPGVLADQQRDEILDAAHHGARLPFDRRLAPADQALVRLHLDKYPVAHLSADDDGREAGDLHLERSSLPCDPLDMLPPV